MLFPQCRSPGLIYVGLSFPARSPCVVSRNSHSVMVATKPLNRAIGFTEIFAEYVPIRLDLALPVGVQAYSRVLAYLRQHVVGWTHLACLRCNQLKGAVSDFRTTGMLLTLFSIILARFRLVVHGL